MIKTFKHKGLRLYFESGKTNGIQAAHSRKIRLILARLNASRTPQDMALPGLRLHQLKGELKGSWAVDVSGNWRIVFSFDGPDIINVDYLDYH
jgi:proteic killer suppression protein